MIYIFTWNMLCYPIALHISSFGGLNLHYVAMAKQHLQNVETPITASITNICISLKKGTQIPAVYLIFNLHILVYKI